MFTMIVVNDYAGMEGLPHWLHHAATNEDMLGLSDVVFPAFLFCMGLSVPFAVGARYERGESVLQMLGHIGWRTMSLLVMGLFAMNGGGVEGGLSGPVFTLLYLAGFFLVWNAYPGFRGKPGMTTTKSGMTMRIAGILLLAGLVVYKTLHGMPFRHGWWGILGLIGWAYLPCALVCVAGKGNFRLLTGFWILTLLLCVLVPGTWPGSWTHVAISATGLFTALLLQRYGAEPRKLIAPLVSLALAMFLLGLLSHRYWIISKNLATPTWAFFCLALCIVLFGLLHGLADVRGHTRWARILAPAATATLTCYLMPSLWYAVQQLLGLHWPAALSYGIPGLLKAIVFAFIIIGLTALFGRLHIKLKL